VVARRSAVSGTAPSGRAISGRRALKNIKQPIFQTKSFPDILLKYLDAILRRPFAHMHLRCLVIIFYDYGT
jgi:hypothetical protein